VETCVLSLPQTPGSWTVTSSSPLSSKPQRLEEKVRRRPNLSSWGSGEHYYTVWLATYSIILGLLGLVNQCLALAKERICCPKDVEIDSLAQRLISRVHSWWHTLTKMVRVTLGRKRKQKQKSKRGQRESKTSPSVLGHLA